MSILATITSAGRNVFRTYQNAKAFSFSASKQGHGISSLSLSLSIVCDACDSLPGMKLGKQPDQAASINRRRFHTVQLMSTKTAHYLKTVRQKIKTILRLLPGLQTMPFGIGM
jgi:hypothetical protein